MLSSLQIFPGESMNYIDFILLLIIFICFAIGWKIRGIYLIFLIIAFFAGILLANITYPFFAKVFFKDAAAKSTQNIIISYIIAFIFFASILVIIGILVSKFFESINMDVFDKLLGALLLIIIVIIPVYFIFNFFTHINFFGFKSAAKTSLLYPLMEKYVLLILKIPAFKIIKMHLFTFFSKKIVI